MNAQTDDNQAKLLANFPMALLLIALLYGGMTILAGIVGNKQVSIGPLAIEAGIFPFLTLVAMSSAVSELYGAAMAKKIVLFGFIPLLFSIAIIFFINILPASHEMDAQRLQSYETIMGQTWRLFAAGIISYGASQMLNITLFAWLRKKEGRFVEIRGAIAAVTSQILDTLLFVSIAFYGVFPIAQLLAGQMIAKTILSITLVPILMRILITLAKNMDKKPA